VDASEVEEENQQSQHDPARSPDGELSQAPDRLVDDGEEN
jgi:hypothetical protein